MSYRICVLLIQPSKHVLDHRDRPALTRQHDLSYVWKCPSAVFHLHEAPRIQHVLLFRLSATTASKAWPVFLAITTGKALAARVEVDAMIP